MHAIFRLIRYFNEPNVPETEPDRLCQRQRILPRFRLDAGSEGQAILPINLSRSPGMIAETDL